MSPDVDFLVVGGGLAGSTLAACLARQGRDVLLVERGDFPRDKLCGEFLSPESQAILKRLDIFDRLTEVEPASIRQARFVGRSGRTVSLRLPAPAHGITRKRLDSVLFEMAAQAGAQTWTQAEVRHLQPQPGGGHRVEIRRADGAVAEVTARTVICAHGRRGRPDHALARTFVGRRHPFIGLKRHHRPAPSADGRALAASLEDHVEIYPFDGGYCGMSFVETGEVNVCLLAHERLLRDRRGAAVSGWPSVVTTIAEQHQPLAHRLTALEPTDRQALAVAAVPFTPKTRYERGVFFVGDAAGMIAPLAGDGQAMALESAHALAELLGHPSSVSPDADRTGRRWDRIWRRRYRVRMALAAGLQRLLLQPAWAEATLWFVGAVPGLADGLARLTRSPTESK